MNDSMQAGSKSEEKWIPIHPKEPVFNTHLDGNVAVAGTRGGGMFGAVVRGGQKRIDPLVILDGNDIRQKHAARKFRLGSEFLPAK